MAEEIVAKLRFVVVGQKDVTNAIKQLDKVQGVQRTVITETGRATKEGLVASKTIESTAKVSSASYDEQKKIIEKVVTAVGKYQGAVSSSYSMQKKTAPEVTTKTKRFAGSMAGLAVSTALAAQRMGPLRVIGFHTAGAFATLGLAGIRTSQAFNASRMAGEKWTAAAGRMRRRAWTVTWAAMSMLGVFFGGFAVLRMFTRAAEMLLRPLADLSMAGETLAKAFAYGLLTGVGPFATGLIDLGTYMEMLPGAYMNFMAVMESAKALLLVTAITLFSNRQFVENLSTALEALAAVLPDLLNKAFIPMMTGLVSLGTFLMQNKDKLIEWAEAFRDRIDLFLRVGMRVIGMVMWLFGLSDAFKGLQANVDAQESPWAKFGARLGTVMLGLLMASVAAMILLPILSLFQTMVLGVAASFYVGGIAAKIYAFMLRTLSPALTNVTAQTTLTTFATLSQAAAFRAAAIAGLKLVIVIGLLSAGLTILMALLATVAAAKVMPEMPVVPGMTPAGIGMPGEGGEVIGTQNIYQSVSIGTVEKTADVEEATDVLTRQGKLARGYGAYAGRG